MAWLPIKDAPRDREILVCVEGDPFSRMVAKWIPSWNGGFFKGLNWSRASDRAPTHYQEIDRVPGCEDYYASIKTASGGRK